MVFFNFFEYFCYFFRLFCYELRRNETERQYSFSIFLGLFQPILAVNEAMLAFFNFFASFLKFSIIRQVRTERNYNFYFFSLPHPLSTDFELKLSHKGIFLFFCYFFKIFYSALGRNVMKQ